MSERNKNKEIINEIKGGNEEVLLYIFRKHYGDLKRIFESYGLNENDISEQAASTVVKIWMEVHRNDFSENIDLTSYLLNTAREKAQELDAERKAAAKSKLNNSKEISTPEQIIAECVNVLDEENRKALQWRYAENYSIEQVSVKLNADVAAAQYFLGKAFAQLSSIVKIRMGYSG